MEKWPNFFIVGAPKAGTTSLYEYLRKIPAVYMSVIKEPHFFSSKKIPNNFSRKIIRDKTKYLELFKDATNEVAIGEASPDYLSDPEVPILIHNTILNAKIIILLRDPVERLYSSYLMLKKVGWLKKSFWDEIKICYNNKNDKTKRHLELHYGIYSESLKRYLDIFGQEKVKIIIFEEFIINPKETVQDILSFLDVDYKIKEFNAEQFNPFAFSRGSGAKSILRSQKISAIADFFMSPSTKRNLKNKILLKEGSKPSLELEAKEFLINYYQEDVKKISTILGRKLPWKNFEKLHI